MQQGRILDNNKEVPAGFVEFRAPMKLRTGGFTSQTTSMLDYELRPAGQTDQNQPDEKICNDHEFGVGP